MGQQDFTAGYTIYYLVKCRKYNLRVTAASWMLPFVTGSPSAYDITLNVKEKRFITSSAGTQVGNNEGNMVCPSQNLSLLPTK